MEVIHDVMCVATKQALDDFIKQWPNYCEYCGASGMKYYPGTRTDPPDTVLCFHCLESNICPRCAGTQLRLISTKKNDWYYCDLCGWDEQLISSGRWEANAMVCPQWECYCFELPINHEFQAIDEGVDECYCGFSASEHDVKTAHKGLGA